MASIKEHFAKYWIYYLFILIEMTCIILYSQFVEFRTFSNSGGDWTEMMAQESVVAGWPILADMNVLIFIGFGFLLTVSKGYGWSAVAINFVLAAMTLQWSTLWNSFWNRVFVGGWGDPIFLDFNILFYSEYVTWSAIIAFGAVYGRLSFAQYLVMTFIFIFFSALSWNITLASFVANDVAGGMNVHAFGALFGLAVSAVAGRKEAKRTTTYISNLFGILGTIFIWIYFPAFNAGFFGNANFRGIVNTYIAMTASVFMTFLFTPLIKDGKLTIQNVLNATLAGGIIVGSTADIIVQPWVGFFLGCLAGVVSVLGFEYIVPFVNNKLKIQDSNGVLALHGVNGILAGIISAVIAGTATGARYPDDFSSNFPAIAAGRTPGVQGGYQLATLAVVIAISIVTGVLTGLLLNLSIFAKVTTPFDDEELWALGDENYAEFKKTDGEPQVVEIKIGEPINSI